MKTFLKSIYLSLAAGLLSSCALWAPQTPAPTAPEPGQQVDWVTHVRDLTLLREWQIRGKIGIRTETDGGSAYLDWTQSFDSFYILLSGPLGQGSTIVSGNPSGARLENSDGTFVSDSPEQLVLEHTGWQIPIKNLLYWIKGIPAPYGNVAMTRTELGTIATLDQDGWHLQYDRYGNALNALLPQRIKIHKDDLKVTLVIKEWIPLSTPGTDRSSDAHTTPARETEPAMINPT